MTLAGALDRALGLVREVTDFPEPGVLFRDLTPVLADRDAFRAVVDALAATVPPDVDAVVALEARGFLFGAALAAVHGHGVVPIRKPGKLPAVADRVTYDLEYGTATLELPADAVRPGQRVVVVDDVLATGGTLAAAAGLLTRAGAEVVGAAVVLEIAALGGRARAGLPVRALRVV
ncbi:adenine phosphoribosyltransferase [Actinokineospora globicatena]|uniref:adenine phosphoribosyltransferase n=1 Tax=Actinokineospora globicatena TaxID=103729 RepID=UPI0020A52BCB|nr:adenine phosphoribosyltransferase [Actinokineospora globicatena]MCP2304202.1 adenine phosphoribosyltransferase [Actinokineospora globicatena]GLW78440.1 adenine phosphoribosyltransferase [Actinokineospora globicatena]GLW84896.1 adenine phosphoribosyltransferase [Actinokineospora globicatena]